MSPDPLRVAVLSVHTCPLAQPGGWETGGMNVYIRELSRELGRRGVRVDVFTRRQDTRSPDVVPFGENARVIHLEAGPRRSIDKYEVLDYLPEFTCNLQRFRALNGAAYDLIHAHYWLSGRVASVLKEVWGVPMVAMFHTLAQVKNQVATDRSEREAEVRAEIEGRMMASANSIIAATDEDRTHMLRLYRASARNIAVIPGGVDLRLFRPSAVKAARQRLGLPANVPVVLFVGRLQRQKGIDILLEAFSLLASESQRGREAQLLVVGGMPSKATEGRSAEERQAHHLTRLARQFDIAERVHFIGAVKQELLPLYYSAADVTVMPSAHESFGLVAVESLACGTPVVASRVGGLTTIVRDQETGYLVPWRHPRLFAERIAAVLEDRSSRGRMRRAARDSARRFSWSDVADQVLVRYQQLTARSRAAASAER